MTFLRPGFCLVLRGTKVMQLANNNYISGSGSLLFIAPHEAILMQHITDEVGFESVIVTFPNQVIEAFNTRYAELLKTASDLNHTSPIEPSTELHQAWQKVIRALTRKEHPELIRHDFEGFLLRLAILGYRVTFHQYDKTFAQRVTERISRHFGTSPTLTDVAKSLFISESTLLRRLKSEGQNYRQLKEDVHLSMAMDRVQANQVSINEIACLAGYSSTSRFIARFKHRFGLTPGALRKLLSPKVNATEESMN